MSEIGSSVTWTLGVRRELAAGLDRTHDSYFYKQYIYNIYIHIFIYRYPSFFLNMCAFLICFLFFFNNYTARLSQQNSSCVFQAWFRGRLRSAGRLLPVLSIMLSVWGISPSFFSFFSFSFFQKKNNCKELLIRTLLIFFLLLFLTFFMISYFLNDFPFKNDVERKRKTSRSLIPAQED